MTKRSQNLERRFRELEALLPEGSEKEALGDSLETIRNLYESAPPMEGSAESEGLPVGTTAPDIHHVPDIQELFDALESIGTSAAKGATVEAS